MAKCHTEFRGERSLLPFCWSSIQVLCGYFALSLVLDGLAECIKRYHPTAMKTEAKRVPQSIKTHSKWSLVALRRLLGRESIPGTPQRWAPQMLFKSATWPTWVAILSPIGFWRGSQNHIFGHRSKYNDKKWGPGSRFEKTWISIHFRCQNERPGVVKVVF